MDLTNAQCVRASLIALKNIEAYLEAYDADTGSEDLKDEGPLLCGRLRELLEAAQ